MTTCWTYLILINVCFLLNSSARKIQFNEKEMVHGALTTETGVQHKTFLTNSDHVLNCTGNASPNDTYFWFDHSTDTRIFIITQSNKNKTEKASMNRKYDNFYILGQFPTSVDLLIKEITINDIGNYSCELIIASEIIQTYSVTVEVIPQSFDLSCSSSAPCPYTQEIEASATVKCTSYITGAYPPTLQILWGHTDGTTHRRQSILGPEGTYDFCSETMFSPSRDEAIIYSQLDGYVNHINQSYTSATYYVYPPICVLDIAPDAYCTEAKLICTCKNAFPNVASYNFYDEKMQLITKTNETNEIKVNISNGINSKYYCRGCNGVNFGEESVGEDEMVCPAGTVTQSTVQQTISITPSGETGVPTMIWISVGVVVFLVLVVGVLVTIIKLGKIKPPCLKKPDDSVVSTPHDKLSYSSSPDSCGNELNELKSQASYVNIPEKPPVYAIVNKQHKLDNSNAPPRPPRNTETSLKEELPSLNFDNVCGSTLNQAQKSEDTLQVGVTGPPSRPPRPPKGSNAVAEDHKWLVDQGKQEQKEINSTQIHHQDSTQIDSRTPPPRPSPALDEVTEDNEEQNGPTIDKQTGADLAQIHDQGEPQIDTIKAPLRPPNCSETSLENKKELQYADIQHTTKTESDYIHQPHHAPTQYATISFPNNTLP